MKTITNNVRSNGSIAIIHLFELEMKNFDGTYKETLQFTDNDIFVNYDNEEYTPIQITFDKCVESVDMSANTIQLTVDNLNTELLATVLESEWRNNSARITRIIYTPKANGDYEFGNGNMMKDGYPQLDVSDVANDSYNIFNGIIDNIDISEKSINVNLGSRFVAWNKPYPSQSYNQRAFTEVIESMTAPIYWGRSVPA